MERAQARAMRDGMCGKAARGASWRATGRARTFVAALHDPAGRPARDVLAVLDGQLGVHMIARLIAKRPLHACRVCHHETGEPLGGRGPLLAFMRESGGAAGGQAERGEGDRGAVVTLAIAIGT